CPAYQFPTNQYSMTLYLRGDGYVYQEPTPANIQPTPIPVPPPPPPPPPAPEPLPPPPVVPHSPDPIVIPPPDYVKHVYIPQDTMYRRVVTALSLASAPLRTEMADTAANLLPGTFHRETEYYMWRADHAVNPIEEITVKV